MHYFIRHGELYFNGETWTVLKSHAETYTQRHAAEVIQELKEFGVEATMESVLFSLRPVREITAEEENFELVPFVAPNHFTTKRNFVEPEPVGTYIVMVFRITGYGQDCDGSALAEIEQVNREGNPTGWTSNAHGLYPDSDLVVEHPSKLWED